MHKNIRSKSIFSFKTVTATGLSLVLVTQLTACGTVFYPERKGLSGGRLDPAIVALDGLGLIFFLIPGLIAFGVDFYHGTIYLPGTKTTQLNEDELNQIRQQDGVDLKALERILSDKLEQEITLDNTTEVVPFSSSENLTNAVNLAQFDHLSQWNYASR